MLIDKRSILKEAEARDAAARTLRAAEEKRKQAEEKNARSAAQRSFTWNVGFGKGEPVMTKEKVAKKVEESAVNAKAAAKETAAKAEPVKAAAAPAKKPVIAKKAVAKKPAAKAAAPKEKVFVQFEGKEIDTASITAEAVKTYKASHKDAVVKTVVVYVKPEESAAYYVINGDASPEYRIDL